MNEKHKLCPKCNTEAKASALLCRKCLFNLRDEPAIIKIFDKTKNDFISTDTRLSIQSNYLKRKSISISLITIYLIIFFLGNIIYITNYRTVPELAQSSKKIQLSTSTNAWPTEFGNANGIRNYNKEFNIYKNFAWEYNFNSTDFFDLRGLSNNIIAHKNFIIFSLVNGELVVLSKEKGELIWSMNISGLLDSTPVIIKDALFFSQRNGKITSIEISTGKIIWQTSTKDVFLTGLDLFDGILYANSLYSLYLFDANTGQKIWSKKIQNINTYPSTSPTAKNEILVINTPNAALHLNRKTGELLHTHRTSWLEHSYIENRTMFLFSKNEIASIDQSARGYWWDKVPGLRWTWGQFTLWGMAPAIPRDDNNWIFYVGKGNYRRNVIQMKLPALDDNYIFTSYIDGSIKAINKQNGTLIWEKQYQGNITDPLITKSGLLIGNEQDLILLNLKNGNEISKVNLNKGVINQFIIANEEIVAEINSEKIILLN
ncbi:MAG: Outer membrane protein assembly factor BamB, contains PQQ-like beta-propeller repeat [Chloroflexi bacterium]|jgi:outer membrane protein assembly factor BamB|nr:MAG: Outer membrane protein assembly factor BamB, contains PQQ-like beta-propeller repeat [Chloroflexota bacterium]|tara:strand:+ start:674 stop:2134 length:1461 start_codon:yes stop_codon:yes gene_type:complete